MPMKVSLPLIEVNLDEIEVFGPWGPRPTRGGTISHRELSICEVQ